MEKRNIATGSRMIIFLSGLILLAVLFTPMWRIDLSAPQYPEGLRLLIYADKIAGDVDIINGLNHYIGMKTLHTDDFIEFSVIPKIIMFFSAAFILVALLGKRKWTYVLLGLFIAFGVLAMVDFWRWEYDYGHNLDPTAAIIVPGMAYQPPLIGFKQLLNFGAYSVPDIGGWIFILAGLALLSVVIYEFRKAKKGRLLAGSKHVMFLITLVFTFTSCSTSPEPINLGKDQCYTCKMTISDQRFGAELVTTKSKQYKFDDIKCLLEFKKSGVVEEENIAAVYMTNFNAPHQLEQADKMMLLKSEALRTPMNGNIAAFNDPDSMALAIKAFGGYTMVWNEMSR